MYREEAYEAYETLCHHITPPHEVFFHGKTQVGQGKMGCVVTRRESTTRNHESVITRREPITMNERTRSLHRCFKEKLAPPRLEPATSPIPM